MEIKIDTDALSNNNLNKAANSNQIIEEMINFHINEMDHFLIKQENKLLIPEYFIIRVLSYVIENTEERSLTILAEIKESYQTLYDLKANDKVFIYSKSNDFFNRLLSHCQNNSRNHNDSNMNNKQNHFNMVNFNTNKDFVKNDFFDNNSKNILNKQSNVGRNNLKNFEMRIDLDENIFFPADEIVNCLSLLYNINLNSYRQENKISNEANKRDFQDKLFFLMLSLSNIIKLYFFYYKKFKFNKWDSFLINSPFFEEAVFLGLIINFMGLKCAINKLAIKNNFDSLSLSDLNDFVFELDNLELIIKESIKNAEDKSSLNINDNNDGDFLTDENHTKIKSNKLEFFYANYIKNLSTNKIDIINLNDQEVKIENLQKEEYLNFDFESKYFNFIFDTTGEGLNNKNKIVFFKLLQYEGNIVINDNINEKIQIDPRDINFMYNKSISINFVNIIKNLKFNVNHGKLTNFVLDFISKMILISDKNIKNIFKKINLSVTFSNLENETNFNVEDLTNKNKFLNLFVIDLLN